MEILERIRLEGTPFPRDLPMPPSQLIEYVFRTTGLRFTSHNRRIVQLQGPYVPGRKEVAEMVVASLPESIKVSHSVWTTFDEIDFQKAPFWGTYFADHWIDDLSFSYQCSECQRKRIKLDPSIRVESVASDRPAITVNGEFKIVNNDTRRLLLDSLSGVRFTPFDEQHEYYYLLANTSFDRLKNKPSEFIGYHGLCRLCGMPICQFICGPVRFDASHWSGEDLMYDVYHESIVFTQKAFHILKAHAPYITQGFPVFVE